MCGIVGLLGKTAEIRESLGGRLTPMFTCMAARGPDSGGLAVFNRPLDDSIRRYSVYSPDRNQDWDGLSQLLRNHLSSDSLSTDKASKIPDFQIRAIENHATIIGNFDTLDHANYPWAVLQESTLWQAPDGQPEARNAVPPPKADYTSASGRS